MDTAIPNPLGQLYGTSDKTTYQYRECRRSTSWFICPLISLIPTGSLANISDNFENIIQDPTLTSGAASVGGTAVYNTTQNFTWLWDNILDYHNSFGKHTLDVIAGLTAQKWNDQYSQNGGSGFPLAGIYSISSASNRSVSQDLGTYDNWSKYSQYGRVMYNYDSRYLLTATNPKERDGSSQLGIHNQYATFPAGFCGMANYQ